MVAQNHTGSSRKLTGALGWTVFFKPSRGMLEWEITTTVTLTSDTHHAQLFVTTPLRSPSTLVRFALGEIDKNFIFS